MGEHKHNPTAQLAKEGKLPPKPRKLGKRESERILLREIYRKTVIEPMMKGVAELEKQYYSEGH